MPSDENMQKYIEEMMRLYKKSAGSDLNKIEQKQAESIESAAESADDMQSKAAAGLPTDTRDEVSAEKAGAIEELTPVELIPAEPDIAQQAHDSGYPEVGYLQISASAGDRAFPINQAVVTVSKPTPLGEAVLSITATDESGKSPIITLPAPHIEHFGKTEKNTPYAVYKVVVTAKGYYTVVNENIPIFSGITSALPVNMIPLPTNGSQLRQFTYYSEEPKF